MFKIDYLFLLHSILGSEPSVKNSIGLIGNILKELETLTTDEEKEEISSKIKTRVQTEVVEAYFKCPYKHKAVYIATGTGKSKIGIDIIDAISKKGYEGGTVLVVVPTIKLRDVTWKEEFIKWNKEYLLTSEIKFICYDSLSKVVDQKIRLTIFDEAHNLTPWAAQDYFKMNSCYEVLYLTATEPKNREKQNMLKGMQVTTVYELFLDEAVTLGIVADYDITLIEVELDKEDKYIVSGKKEKRFLTTETGKYTYLSKLFYNSPNSYYSGQRRALIHNLKSKLIAAKLILKHVIPEEYKTLIFAASIEQAIEVCPRRYFSKPPIKKKDSPERIERTLKIHAVYEGDIALKEFREDRIKRMSCVHGLNEGQNIDNLDLILVIQIDSVDLNITQRIGRVVRFRAGHKGKVIVIVAKGTVDRDWFNKSTKFFDQNKIKVYQLNDLRTGKETITFN